MKKLLAATFAALLMVGCGEEETLFERSKRLAESGHAPAQFNLGLMYALGQGGLAEDKTEAVKWYRKAARQGEVKAQFNLALMYAFGEGGLAEDKTEAVRWFRKAADQGEVKAQYKLGVAYANGIGVSKDKTEAVRWFRKAADQGDALARSYLTAQALGVPKGGTTIEANTTK